MSKTETQSEALRLASKLRGEAEGSIVKYSTAHMAAKELERLDAENKALRERLDGLPAYKPLRPEQIVEIESKSYVDGTRPVYTTDCWGDEKVESEPTTYFNYFMFARGIEAAVLAAAKTGDAA